MPRVSRQQTEKNRAGIEDASARLFREQGFKGVSVADLMAAAGLTHGGFYGHFSSKDELLAVACGKAFEQSATRWRQRIAAQPDRHAAFDTLVDNFLSPASRSHVGSGCPAVALAGDVAREAPEAPVRAAYLSGVKGMLAQLAALSAAADPQQRAEQALVQLSAMVGALALARATDGDPLSDQLLAMVGAFLKADAAAK